MRSRFTITVWLFALLDASTVGPSALAQWTTVAPGIEYRQYGLSAPDPAPNNVFVTRMARSNLSCIVDSTIAQGQLRTGRETIPAQAVRYDDTINYWGETWGQRSDVVVAINGDGWTTAPGPTNGQIASGWNAWRWPEYAGRSGFCFKLDRSCFLGGNVRNAAQYQFIYFANGNSVSPTAVNKDRAGGDELIVFTPQFADRTYTDSTGTEVLVELSRPLLSFPVGSGSSVEGTIRQVRAGAGSTPIPFDHLVLSGTGSYVNVLKNNCAVGAKVRLQFEIHDYGTTGQVPTASSDWTRAFASLGCFAYVVKNGIVPSEDWATNTGALIRNPRTSVAFNDTYIYFMVCDGRSAQSVGMTYTEMGNWLVANLDAKWATNQDGGGSSTMWVNGQVKNVPSDGTPRACANGLVMAVVQPRVQATTFTAAQAVTTSGGASVYLGPGTNYGILTAVTAGTQGQVASHALNGVLAKGSNWWKVDFGGGAVGWVAGSMLVGGGVGPTISGQPASLTLGVGTTATFAVTATGDAPLAYQWQKNGLNLSNGGHVAGAATPSVTVSNVDVNDVGTYRCVVSNGFGTATSYEATLTLTGQPTITQHPQPQNVCPGDTAGFAIAASGQGTLAYRWQRNGVDLADGGHFANTGTPALTISAASAAEAGSYRCVVSNAAGSTGSNQAPLTLNAVHAIVGLGGGSTVSGASTDGAVVAGNNGSGGFIWTTTSGVVGLGAGTSTAGVATRNGAVVAGGLSGGNAARWDGTSAGLGSWSLLPTTGVAWTPLCTSAQNGSPGDVIIAGTTGGATGTKQAVRYRESAASTSALALPANGNKDAYIYGVSDGGVYAGRYQYGNTSPSGSRQAMGGATLGALSPLIGSPGTTNEGVANAISRDGTRAGGWSNAPGFSRQGTVWTISSPGSPQAVAFLGTDDYGEIQALNGDGSMAAGYAQTLAVSGSKRAIIWDAVNGTRDLRTWLVAQYGLDLAGWTLTDVKGLSGDGKVIAGNGVHNGNSEAYVALLGVAGSPPTITQQPVAQAVCVGANATLAVAAGGLGTLQYRWQKNGTDLENGGHCSGAASPVLSITGADATDVATYRCAVRAGCNQVFSDEVGLAVREVIGADLDRDCDVDQDDVAVFLACITGPGQGPIASGCGSSDLDGDSDVDQSDFSRLQRCLDSPGTVPDPACAATP